MGIIKSFRDLDAWRVAMDLAVLAHGKANELPASERFELASQIRRATRTANSESRTASSESRTANRESYNE